MSDTFTNIVLGIGLVLLLAGCIIGGYFLLRKPNQGQLELRVTDKVDGDITSVILTVSQIRISSVSSDSDSDKVGTILMEGPVTFDLVTVKGIEEILGSQSLPEAEYRQLRMVVDKCMVTLNGEQIEATVPSGVLKVVHPFQITKGKTTVVTLDFDANESLVQAGDKLMLRPVVKLLVRDSTQPFNVQETFGAMP